MTDDEEGALKLLSEAVKEALPNDEKTLGQGFNNPEMALKYAEENTVDVAFLDIDMRGMSGIELAKRLKRTNPKINVIFVTGYVEYAIEAVKLHASGYLQKPVDADDIREAMNNLLYEEEQSEVFIKTFGNFDLFYKGKTVEFKRNKAKEMLAYLVDLEGASATRREIAAIIFENEEYSYKQMNYFTQIYKSLKNTLRSVGIEDILIKGRNVYSINLNNIKCDMKEYKDGNPKVINSFKGEYMMQYSWAEMSVGKFYN